MCVCVCLTEPPSPAIRRLGVCGEPGGGQGSPLRSWPARGALPAAPGRAEGTKKNPQDRPGLPFGARRGCRCPSDSSANTSGNTEEKKNKIKKTAFFLGFRPRPAAPGAGDIPLSPGPSRTPRGSLALLPPPARPAPSRRPLFAWGRAAAPFLGDGSAPSQVPNRGDLRRRGLLIFFFNSFLTRNSPQIFFFFFFPQQTVPRCRARCASLPAPHPAPKRQNSNFWHRQNPKAEQGRKPRGGLWGQPSPLGSSVAAR